MTPPTASIAPGAHDRARWLATIRIAVITWAVLTLELALIRLVPAEVHSISYFTNLLLMSAFYGLARGCLKERGRSLAWWLPVGLGLVAGFVFVARGLVVHAESEDTHFWIANQRVTGSALEIPLLLAALLAFIVCSLPFVALGQKLAQAMAEVPRLTAYGWDIGGSIAGTASFALGTALGMPPWAWPPLVMLVWAAVFVRGYGQRAIHLAAGLCFLLFVEGGPARTWSPYYLVQHETNEVGTRVWVNSSFHQQMLDFSPADPGSRRDRISTEMRERFGLPYQRYRELHDGRAPARVLVLGAGTGNDVYVALSNGAEHVTAVEIDPAILELGERLNPMRPYDSPRVRTIVDDARHFLRVTSERFDLIVFGTLDSQTLLSSQANLRLENYVYTRQAFEQASERLAPDGMLAAYYSVYQPWLYARLWQTLCPVFPGRCELIRPDGHQLFNAVFLASHAQGGVVTPPGQAQQLGGGVASTDDWPFLYLRDKQISSLYLQLLAFVACLVVLVFLALRRETAERRPHLELFFLGIGFTLVEAVAVVRLALLFGSTWQVTSVVFTAVLSMVLLANWLTQRGRVPSLHVCFAGAIAGAVVNYAVPAAALLALDAPQRALAAAALVALPVFFASVAFSRLFAREQSSGYALGINLVGAMLGGFLEYGSMAVGLSAIWLLAAAVYAAAWVAFAALSARPGRASSPRSAS